MKRIGGIALVTALALSGCLIAPSTREAAPSEAAESAAPPATTPAPQEVAPDVVGLTLDIAREMLANFELVEIDGTGQGRSVWAAENWTVTAQAQSGNTVTLTLANKRDEAGTQSDTLPARVTEALLAASGVASFQDLEPTSPGYWIAGIETVSAGTVRATIQTTLTDEERESAGRWVMQMACGTVEDLDVVVIRDSSGIDSNHYRRNYQLCT